MTDLTCLGQLAAEGNKAAVSRVEKAMHEVWTMREAARFTADAHVEREKVLQNRRDISCLLLGVFLIYVAWQPAGWTIYGADPANARPGSHILVFAVAIAIAETIFNSISSLNSAKAYAGWEDLYVRLTTYETKMMYAEPRLFDTAAAEAELAKFRAQKQALGSMTARTHNTAYALACAKLNSHFYKTAHDKFKLAGWTELAQIALDEHTRHEAKRGESE
jgi:hypothetical protein